jgi:hypothetical protein
MKIDLPVESIDTKTKDKFNLIVVDPNAGYVVGSLTDSPLKYTPGYNPRFYEDPWFVIKVSPNSRLNGSLFDSSEVGLPNYIRGKKGYQRVTHTAPTRRAAKNFVRTQNRIQIEKGLDEVFDFVRARDLTQAERMFANIDKLQLEGRLFFDTRNGPLRQIYGNRAPLTDPIEAVMDSINIFSNQVTMEEVIKSFKQSFITTFEKLNLFREGTKEQFLSSRASYEDIFNDLRKVTGEESSQAKQALKFLNYIRLLEGANTSKAGAILRMNTADVASSIASLKVVPTNLGKRLEIIGQEINPLQFVRDVAFQAFMVLRPARQLVLQQAQVGFLSPLDPTYFAGFGPIRDLNFFKLLEWFGKSTNPIEKTMLRMAETLSTFSKEDMNEVIHNMRARGLIESVDLHSYASGLGKEPVAARASLPTRVVKKLDTAFRQAGFDQGEIGNNVMSSFVAIRRYLKDNNKTLKELSNDDWDRIITNTSNMALGMLRPNNLAYQQGMLSATTQFLSFTHKIFSTLMGANPAFTKMDSFKLFVGNVFLWGGSLFGIREWLADSLVALDVKLDNEADHVEMIDNISAGAFDYVFNEFLKLFMEENESELAIGDFLAPGGNVINIAKTMFEIAANSPQETLLGPGGSILSRFYKSADYVWTLTGHGRDLPENAFSDFMEILLSGALPAFSDYTQAKLALEMDTLFTRAGEPKHLEPSFQELFAKSLLGVNSKHNLAFLDLTIGTSKRQQALTEDARKMYDVAKLYARRHVLDEIPFERMEQMAKALRTMIKAHEPRDRAFLIVQFINRMNEDQEISLDEIVNDIIFSDDAVFSGDTRMINNINQLPLSDQDKKTVTDFILGNIKPREEFANTLVKDLEETIRTLEQENR